MKVAIPLFRNGVSPRIDIADSLLIYDIDNGVIKRKETCSLNFEYAAQLISILQEKQITRIICAGCPQFFLRMLYFYDIEVVPGVMEDPEYIVKQLVDGKLSDISFKGLMGRSCGHRYRHGRGGKGGDGHGKRKRNQAILEEVKQENKNKKRHKE
jgi:predicted Fe-Mo cluster-binding NifX family protein